LVDHTAGPKDWLKEQKKKASKFVLAPIDASRESLRSAYVLLSTNLSLSLSNSLVSSFLNLLFNLVGF
jgi:hypothetical protein